MRKLKKVTWKTPPAGVVQEKAKRPRSYQQDAALPPQLQEKYEISLVPGSLWTVAVEHVAPISPPPDEEIPPHPYLHGSHWPAYPGMLAFSKGTMAIYMGTTRVTELNRTKLVSIPRHTFLVNGSTYITRNLNDWMPVA